MKCNYKIKGLDCANCAAELERAISKVKGVEKVTISFMSEKMTIELDENNKSSVIKDVEKVIYDSNHNPIVTLNSAEDLYNYLMNDVTPTYLNNNAE